LVPNAQIALFFWFVHFHMFMSSTWEVCLNRISKLPHALLILQICGIRDCTPSFQITLCWKVYPNTLWQGLGSCEIQCSLHLLYIFLLIHIIIPFVNEFLGFFFIDSTHVLNKFCGVLKFIMTHHLWCFMGMILSKKK